MGVRRPNAPWVVTRNVILQGPFNSDSSCGTVTAPDVAGYDFMMWVAAVSNSYIGSPYCTPATSRRASVYDANYQSAKSNSTSITCIALYQRTTS